MADFRPDDPETPARAILDMLKDGRWHSGLLLREKGGGHNYTARIDELRARGHAIETSKRRGRDGFATYRLVNSGCSVLREPTVRCELTYRELHALVKEKKAPDSMKRKLEKAWQRVKAKQAAIDRNRTDPGRDEINAVLDELLGGR